MSGNTSACDFGHVALRIFLQVARTFGHLCRRPVQGSGAFQPVYRQEGRFREPNPVYSSVRNAWI